MRRRILVRSKVNEHITRKISVTKPGLTALLNTSSELTKEAPKQASVAAANTRSGTC